MAESDLSGNLKSEYVFFGGERIARKDFVDGTTSVAYYFSDHLKTASVITNSAGAITEDEDYYPWGGELQFVNSDSNHYKFTGKERDSETQLDYFGARYYGNWLGRWMSPDWAAKPEAVPYSDLHDPQSLNLYSYVRNVPTSRSDPYGHQDCQPACDSAAGTPFEGAVAHPIYFFKGLAKGALNMMPAGDCGSSCAQNIEVNEPANAIEANGMAAAPLVVAAVSGSLDLAAAASAAVGAQSVSTAEEVSQSAGNASSIAKEGIYEGADATAPR